MSESDRTGQYLNKQRKRALKWLDHKPGPKDDPLLLLLCQHLLDDRGNAQPPSDQPDPTDRQMDKFLLLYRQQSQNFLPLLEKALSREGLSVPSRRSQVPDWAREVVLLSLDEAGHL